MTKREMLEAMGITATPSRLTISKDKIERFFAYWQKKEDKELARRFILQFLPR